MPHEPDDAGLCNHGLPGNLMRRHCQSLGVIPEAAELGQGGVVVVVTVFLGPKTRLSLITWHRMIE